MTALQRARQAARKALESTYEGRATVVEYQKVKDEWGMTNFQEVNVLEDQPCKLSFETLTSSSGDPVAAVAQTVKLFLSPDVEIPAGCKIVVTRFNNLERKFTYSKSGEAGVFTNHQEIQLEPWKGYA